MKVLYIIVPYRHTILIKFLLYEDTSLYTYAYVKQAIC